MMDFWTNISYIYIYDIGIINIPRYLQFLPSKLFLGETRTYTGFEAHLGVNDLKNYDT